MKSTSFFIFIVLFLLTSITFFSSYFTLGVTGLLIVTFIKGFLIVNYFMELRHVRLRYSMIIFAWLLIVLLLIYISFKF